MNCVSIDTVNDQWSDWLLHRRHANNPEYQEVINREVDQYAEWVLTNAQLGASMTLADIGTGEGLIALRAIQRIGPSLQVILTDVSSAMLQHVEALAQQQGVYGQCRFLNCDAEHLQQIATASVDVVTTRSVLAYVNDKNAALREFLRILKPNGRLSCAEPVFRDDALAAKALKQVLDTRTPEVKDHFMLLLHRWKSAQFPDTDEKICNSPIANYSERDLVQMVHNCGFADIHMEFHMDVLPSSIPSWEVFIESSPHPWAPSLRTIMAEQFSLEEQAFFEKILRPSIENIHAVSIERMLYLSAVKP